MRWLIRNVKLILTDGVAEGALLSQDGKIVEVYTDGAIPPHAEDARVVDGGGDYLAPGLIELHSHGAGGADCMDGTVDAFRVMARTELAHGVTTLLPTSLTSTTEELFQTIDLFRKAQTLTERMPNLYGLHLEGPYFSYAQRGAQDPRYLKSPERDEYLRILEYGQGAIARWSVAPELDGALEMGDELAKRGVVASIG
ncbi:MAG: amidohydrolase family protein, partial [Eubacteriales bacterium]|nr:amidohydrolase family protein [Eubacteriales bacterium]